MKSTDAQVSQRVKAISSLLIKGRSREDILQYASKKWKVSERQIDAYIAKAKETIADTAKKSVEYDYAKAIIRFDYLFQKSLAAKDFRTALVANKELATLQGLFKTSIEHSGSVQFISNIPD